MSHSKVKFDFIKLPIPEKIQFSRNRVQDMENNPNFSSPDVPYMDINNGADDLEAKYNLAQGAGPAQTAAQNAAEKVLDGLLRKLAAYVDRIADGNVVFITSTGFTPTQTTHTPSALPGKPENLRLKHGGQPGTILSDCDTLAHAKGYVTLVSDTAHPNVSVSGGSIILQASGNIFMLFNSGTTHKAAFSGLTSGKRYFVWKYAFNAQGRGPDSDVIGIVAP